MCVCVCVCVCVRVCVMEIINGELINMKIIYTRERERERESEWDSERVNK